MWYILSTLDEVQLTELTFNLINLLPSDEREAAIQDFNLISVLCVCHISSSPSSLQSLLHANCQFITAFVLFQLKILFFCFETMMIRP